MYENPPQHAEVSDVDEQSVIFEAINRVLVNSSDYRMLVDPSNPLKSICHHIINIDQEDQVYLEAIKGKHNPEHILEFNVSSMKPGNEEVRILGWIDLQNNVVTDENGQPLSTEGLQNLSDCIKQFPERSYSPSDSPSEPEEDSTSEFMP